MKGGPDVIKIKFSRGSCNLDFKVTVTVSMQHLGLFRDKVKR